MAKKTDKQKSADFVAFLKKRLESKNYKANVSPEEYNKTKKQYDKEKFKLKMMR